MPSSSPPSRLQAGHTRRDRRASSESSLAAQRDSSPPSRPRPEQRYFPLMLPVSWGATVCAGISAPPPPSGSPVCKQVCLCRLALNAQVVAELAFEALGALQETRRTGVPPVSAGGQAGKQSIIRSIMGHLFRCRAHSFIPTIIHSRIRQRCSSTDACCTHLAMPEELAQNGLGVDACGRAAAQRGEGAAATSGDGTSALSGEGTTGLWTRGEGALHRGSGARGSLRAPAAYRPPQPFFTSTAMRARAPLPHCHPHDWWAHR